MALDRSLILALDIGTSSVRASLYDRGGEAVPAASVKNERTLTATADGGAEIDADVAFRQVVGAIDDVLQISETVGGEIAHVAAAAFWHSIVGVDAAGKPTTPVLGWADNRSREQVTVLRERLNETEVHNRCGARFHSSFWPAKLLWLRKQFPEVFRRTAMWLSFSDYLSMKLTGSPATSVSMASATGIFDIRKCDWDDELLTFLKVKRTQLPPIAADRETLRPLPKFARRWPRLKNGLVSPAIGDGAANNVGSGCVTKSKAALMVGTSGAMRVAYRGEPPATIPPGLWCYRVDRKRVIVGGALSDGGGLYDWLKKNLNLGLTDAEIDAEIARRPPAGHGLTFLPFLAGERSTGYHEFASGAMIGLKTATDPIDILQAALESVAYRFAEIFDQLDQVARIREIVASGGALLESTVWTRIIADVLGRTLSLTDIPEASSRGAVLLALETFGKLDNLEQTPAPNGRKLAVDEANARLHRRSRKRHSELYGILMP